MRSATDALTADDLREIHNLIANYAFAVDAQDTETLRGTWAYEGTLHLIPDVASLGAPLRGRENIVEAFRGFWAERRRAAADRTLSATPLRHICGCPWIDRVEGLVAGETTMMQLNRRADATLEVARSGVYHDRFAFESGRWVFAERRLEYDVE